MLRNTLGRQMLLNECQMRCLYQEEGSRVRLLRRMKYHAVETKLTRDLVNPIENIYSAEEEDNPPAGSTHLPIESRTTEYLCRLKCVQDFAEPMFLWPLRSFQQKKMAPFDREGHDSARSA